MPIDVNELERRTVLAEAVWTLVRKGGIEAASVRNVAREAGLSTGSVRHFFPTQAALHGFAMRLVTDRVQARVARLELPSEPLSAARLALAELLPLDDERRAENLVWFTFSSAALTDPALAEIHTQASDDLRSVALHWTRRLLPADAPEPVVRVEAERLSALMDGLAVHAALRPDGSTPELMREVLDRQLAELAGAPVLPAVG